MPSKTIEILRPVFGEYSRGIALNYTCFPMSDEHSSIQAQVMVDNIERAWYKRVKNPIQEVLDAIEEGFERDTEEALNMYFETNFLPGDSI